MGMPSVPDPADPDRVLMGYRALLEPRAVTDVLLRATLETYPELLSDIAGELGRALAFIQSPEAARDNVLLVVQLLEACRKLGVEGALREHRRTTADEQAKERVKTRADADMRARRGRTDARPVERAPWAARDPFDSLAACRTWFEETFTQDSVEIKAKSVVGDGDDEPFDAVAPRFVYRGESGVFGRTVSSLDRVIADPGVTPSALQDILSTTLALRRDLESAWELPTLLAQGYLQHYGLPTYDFDVSDSLDVACSFGSDLAVGEVGALCAMPTARLVEQVRLVDLRDHPKAHRPRRQHAWVITDPDRVHRDLKDPHTVNACEIRWAQFVMTDSDVETFRPNPWLLDAHSDPAAGLIQVLMDSYEQIEDGAARWIAGRLQPAPFAFLTVPDPNDPDRVAVEWVSADEAGIPYNETDVRTRNWRYWSRRFPRPVKKDLPAEWAEWVPDLDPTTTPPGTVLRVLSRRGLEAIGFLMRGREEP
jgi:hypothetical protein